MRWLAAVCLVAPRSLDALDASEIPVVNTVRKNGNGVNPATCGAAESDGEFYPPEALAECDEPLCDGCPDMRGYWTGFRQAADGGDGFDRVEWRIEQCGQRFVLSGPAGPDGGRRYSSGVVLC